MTPLWGLPTETIGRLRDLDPAAGSAKVSPETSRTIRERIMADPKPEPDDRLVPVDRHPGSALTQTGRKPLAPRFMVVAIVALVVGVGAVVSRSPGSELPDVAATVATDQSRSDLIGRTNPLAVGRQVSCGDLSVPVEVLTEPGTAENGTSESSTALRAFLAHNPFEGMGTVTGQDWLKLGESDQVLVFGQRRGTVGVGPVVTFKRSGDTWQPTGLGGCGLVVPGPGEQAAHIEGAKLDGDRLQLTWMNGTCAGKEPDRVAVRTETAVTPSGLHLLLVTKDNPAAPKTEVCFGVGKVSTALVTLTPSVAALVTGGVFDDGGVPAERVQLT